jgi:CBS domain-containing protein
MAQKIRDVMTKNVTTVEHGTTLVDAAKCMDREDIGNVLITESGKACGIITDRDIVVRGLAKGCDPTTTTVGELCSHDLVTLTPDSSLEEAKKLMSDKAIRRLPVVDGGKPVGIVSLGDIAIEGNGERPLEDISKAPSNN